MKRGNIIILLLVVLVSAISTTLIIKEGISGAAQIQPVTYPGQQIIPTPQCCKTGYASYNPSAHVPVGKCMEAYNKAMATILQECPQIHTSKCTDTKTQYANTCQVEICCPIIQY